MRKAYLTNSRELKRLEAVSRSPVYADFSATLEGINTLLAYDLQAQMTDVFWKRLETNARAWFSFLMLNRWLGFRLDMQCTVVVVVATILAVVLRQNTSSINVGLLGFALVYILQLGGLFQFAVRQSAEVEDSMTAIERLLTYSNLIPETGYIKDTYQPQSGYVGKQLELRNVEVRYRSDLQPRLINANLIIPSKYKVGVCGRTGGGKSTLMLALMRLNIISSGDMRLGDKSLLEMDIQTSRRQFASIGQEAYFFSGSVRFNIDPFEEYTDDEIWGALRDAHIYDKIKSNPLGLQALISEKGQNYSVGERQLLSLARAILRGAPVVLCDEVTASVDFQTDALIQRTLRQSPALKNATLITIAHRLRTICDYDMVVYIDQGHIAEVGSPRELLTQPTSLFYKLCAETNELEEIKRLAFAKNVEEIK